MSVTTIEIDEPIGSLDEAPPECLKHTGVRMFYGRDELVMSSPVPEAEARKQRAFLPQVFIKDIERRPYTFLGVLRDGPLAGCAILARNRRYGYDPVGVHTVPLDRLEPCDRSFYPV